MSQSIAIVACIAVAYILLRDRRKARAAGVPILILAAVPVVAAPVPTLIKLGTFDDTRPFRYVLFRGNGGLLIEVHEVSRVIIETDGSVTRAYAEKPCRVWVSRSTTFTAAGVRIPDAGHDCRSTLPHRITVTVSAGEVSLETEDPPEPSTQVAGGRRPPWHASS